MQKNNFIVHSCSGEWVRMTVTSYLRRIIFLSFSFYGLNVLENYYECNGMSLVCLYYCCDIYSGENKAFLYRKCLRDENCKEFFIIHSHFNYFYK